MAATTSFKDLIAWQKSNTLTLAVYKITQDFPDTEKWGLVSQMRRCSVSISSNIAEGYGRQTSRDKKRFLTIASGSATELESQIFVCEKLGLIDENAYQELTDRCVEVHKLINGLKRSITRKETVASKV